MVNLKEFAAGLILLLCLCLSGCTSKGGDELKRWMEPNGKLKVLSTIGMIDDLVKNVGGEHVDTLTLVNGELDPHSYQLVKGDDEKLGFSQVIFFCGLGLEHGPSLRKYLTESKKAVSLGDRLMLESPSLFLFYDGTVDPHIWMDISMWQQTVPAIVDTLAARDPAHASYYRERGVALQEKMLEAHNRLKEKMSAVPERKRYLVTSHDAFNYFARAYLATDSERVDGSWTERFQAPEGLAPESQLSATDIRYILEHMKKYNVNVIFPESNVSQASIRKLVSAGSEEGMHVVIAKEALYGDAMGPPGSTGDKYLKMITHNIDTLVNNLMHNGLSEEKNNHGRAH